MIICVTKKYHETCRLEAEYAKGLSLLNRCSILFAFLDENYTTDSEPERVKGWLANMIQRSGGIVWFPMWTKFQSQAAHQETEGIICRTLSLKEIKSLKSLA